MKLEQELMAITILLLNRKRVQAQELADRLEVSLRTIYRDLESLNLAGIPIVSYTGAEGGFEIMENFRLDRQMLSFDELIALSTALRGLHLNLRKHLATKIWTGCSIKLEHWSRRQNKVVWLVLIRS